MKVLVIVTHAQDVRKLHAAEGATPLDTVSAYVSLESPGDIPR